jgi:hypothetical protein
MEDRQAIRETLMRTRTALARWLKWTLPWLALWQVGPCTSDALVRSLENQVVFSASSAVFTAAQTVAMNLLGL